MKHTVLAVVVAALAAGGVGSAEAQVPGIPVYNAGIPRGVGIYGDVGLPNDEAGGGTAYAVTGRAGFGPLGATAILSTYNPDGPAGSDISVGATLNYRVFGGPLVPLAVTLQGGIGYAKPELGTLPDEDVTQLRFPVGVGFALTIPNPALAIKPWLAPRLDIVRLSGDGFESQTDTEFALSGGLELNMLGGFGVHASYDAVFAEGGTPGVFGLGAHYTFRVPGL
ncbi:MAG TPA: hypothetical protein VG500_03060 [Gemmatimonadales bacterium]|jgi:hypothetical protein|nr:hypothetical protein [Gemmatimonadales bacterium]